MARIRSIKPEFWKSEVVGRCSPLARLTFIGMWNFADDDGRGRGDDRYLWGEIHPYGNASTRRRFRPALKELERLRLVEFYKDPRDCAYYWIPGFKEHQRVDHPSKSRLPEPPSVANPREDARLDQGSGIRDQGSGKGGEPDPAPVNGGTIEGMLAKTWSRGVGYPCNQRSASKIIRCALDRGAKASEIERVFWSEDACKGRKLWEVIDPLVPSGTPGQRDFVKEIMETFKGARK